MENTNKQIENDKSNNRKKILLSSIAVTLIAVIVYLLVVLNSNAWLYDNGTWAKSEYFVGKISYYYEINDAFIDTEEPAETRLVATVPIMGGVKINDSETANADAQNYQKNAQANFNEGVTVVHITVQNTSGFTINGNYNLIFENMMDDDKNIFYAILPMGSNVDTNKKTVNNVEYKNYIKTVFNNNYSTYDNMISSLKLYYNENPSLKSNEFHLDGDSSLASSSLTIDILMWSEYNGKLPFVNTDGSLKDANPSAGIEGTFSLKFEVTQD